MRLRRFSRPLVVIALLGALAACGDAEGDSATTTADSVADTAGETDETAPPTNGDVLPAGEGVHGVTDDTIIVGIGTANLAEGVDQAEANSGAEVEIDVSDLDAAMNAVLQYV